MIKRNQIINQLKSHVAEGMINIGNLAFGSLIFGQFIGNENFNIILALTGVFSWILFYLLAIAIILLDKSKIKEIIK